MTGARFWAARAGFGLLFGAAIASLEFAHYFPLTAAPHPIGLEAFASLILVWGGNGILLALTVALAERAVRPRELRPWQLALAVALGALGGVSIWQAFVQLALREQLGIRLFMDHVGQPIVWTGVVLYHGWIMLFFGGLAAAVYASQRRRVRMLLALRAAELRRAESQQRLAEARLAALHARVEPDYLLDTFSRLEQSYESDPAAADRLLDELIAFLRAALADIRTAGKLPTSALEVT
jgi:hypothetical protein